MAKKKKQNRIKLTLKNFHADHEAEFDLFMHAQMYLYGDQFEWEGKVYINNQSVRRTNTKTGVSKDFLIPHQCLLQG